MLQCGLVQVYRFAARRSWNLLSCCEKVFDCDASPARNRTESSLCHVASLARRGDLLLCSLVSPDFMDFRTRSIKQIT